MNMLKILLVSVILVGCTTIKEKQVDKLVYVTNPLTAPARPTLPTWTGKDMSCLSEEMKQKIRDRDRLRKEYAEDLEAIISSTHSNSK